MIILPRQARDKHRENSQKRTLFGQNRTCHVNVPALEGDCPIFKDITFEDIAIAGAVRTGDINGFKGDLLQGLTFKNVSFAEKPKGDWTCGYTDLASFSAVDVNPPLTCSSGEAGSPTGACLAAMNATGCHSGRGCRKCFGCVVPSDGGCTGSKPAKAGCSDEMIESFCKPPSVLAAPVAAGGDAINQGGKHPH
jgi:hypothetical protein